MAETRPPVVVITGLSFCKPCAGIDGCAGASRTARPTVALQTGRIFRELARELLGNCPINFSSKKEGDGIDFDEGLGITGQRRPFIDKWVPGSVHRGVSYTSRRSAVMNWDTIKGNWKQITGKAKQKWGQLTDDDLTVVAGKRDELAGILQKKYGYGKEQAEKELDDFTKSLDKP
jgi:uncharacterized protein YjbJ (UPF0337 family)